MKAIFDADQLARTTTSLNDAAKWVEITKQDAERRAQTKALLDAGKLRTGEDFVRAAFVFQHGSEPEDYLLAHILATVAIAKGSKQGLWISAATLDRYLQKSKRPQVFGTQFSGIPNSGKWTQDPYDRALISDALRAVFGVPPLTEQEKSLRAYEDTYAPKK